MKTSLLNFLLVPLLLLSSCNNGEIFTNNQISKANNSKIINLAGNKVELKDGMLAFSSKDELTEIAKELLPLVHTKSGDGLFSIDESQVNELKKNGFKSIYDMFESAMIEAESYYERKGGYEEFKEKYSMLFFPEEGDDYSAYLPISNKKLSRLANLNGDVLINNEVVSLKDITTYQQLVDLEETPPIEIMTRASSGDVISGINKIPETKSGKEKVWINSNTGLDGSIPIVKVTIGFRRKNFAGIWYNHQSNTVATLKGRGGLKLYAGKDHQSAVSTKAFSPHEYYYAAEGLGPIPGEPFAIPVEQDIDIEQWASGLEFKLRCSYKSFPHP